MNSLSNLYVKYGELLKQYVVYFGIGILGAVVDIGIFTLLFKFVALNYLLSFLAGKILGMLNNFVLNAKFNFKTNDKILQRLLSFVTIGSVGIVIGTGAMYILVDKLHLDALICNIAVTFVIATLQFFVNRMVSFKKKL